MIVNAASPCSGRTRHRPTRLEFEIRHNSRLHVIHVLFTGLQRYRNRRLSAVEPAV